MQRFWNKVSKTHECWEWTAAMDTHGYGRFHVRVGRLEGAHRFSWELAYGPIPNGLFVLHRCDNRRCVNPKHLFLGTHDENMQDMSAKGRGTNSRKGKSPRAKLSESQVGEIRRLAASGVLQKEIGEKFGICQRQVSRIVCRHNWANG